MNTEKTIEELVKILKSVTQGSVSVALSGSRAKNMFDEESDIDLYMLVENLKTYDEIYVIISQAADDGFPIYISTAFDSAPYGGSISFYYKGIPIEVTIQQFSKAKQRIDDCLEGRFEIIPQTWTSNGYYTFICLSELNSVKPIWESDRFIETYKEKLVQYPEKLRKSIISVFWARSTTWIDNFHYESAINRGDYLFTSPIVLHTVLDMIQVIFALNRVYFPGDKRLDTVLKSLPYCPKSLIENLPFLLQASTDQKHLKKQYEILKSVIEELRIRIDKEN